MNLPVECDRYQREDRRGDRPVCDEIGRHAQFHSERPIRVEHVNEIRQAVERRHQQVGYTQADHVTVRDGPHTSVS